MQILLQPSIQWRQRYLSLHPRWQPRNLLMENILTDGEYNRLIDRFNRMVLKTHEKEENEKVDTEGHAVLL